MQNLEQTIAMLGNEPPLTTGGRSGPPDRREVSARWLSGTFLTGLTSAVLMGVALIAALDGREDAARASFESVVALAPNSKQADRARAYLAQLAE